MPPDPRDWLPGGHLAWFVLEWVEQMDLASFYGFYRVDGWGRAAFEPSALTTTLPEVSVHGAAAGLYVVLHLPRRPQRADGARRRARTGYRP
jgi:hypothetical protein